MKNAPIIVLLAATVSLLSRPPRDSHDSQSSTERGGHCAPINYAVFGTSASRTLEEPSHIAGTFTSRIRSLSDSVIYADSVDLDCDGTFALVDVVIPRGSGRLARPVFEVYRSENGQFRRVLYAPSRVDGPEKLAVALDMRGSGRRDLVIIGGDEGWICPSAISAKGSRIH
jgi:hypothetical protein